MALSNLEWVFTIDQHDVCLVACLDVPGEQSTIDRLATYLQDLLVFPFLGRSGVDSRAGEPAVEIVEYDQAPDIDRLLRDATSWLAAERRDRPVLAGLYVVSAGFDGVARQLGSEDCRSIVVFLASHAIIDGINLPALSKKVEKAAGEDGAGRTAAVSRQVRFRGLARGVADALRYSARAITTRDQPFEPVYLVADVPRASLISAAASIGVGSEALCYALVLHLVGSGATSPHWVDRSGKAIIAFRPGSLRPEYEPFLRLGFDRIRVHAGQDLAETARQVGRELQANRPNQDVAFIAGQTAIGLTRLVARVVGDWIGKYIVHRVNSETMTFSFYPLKPGALVPDGIEIIGGAAYSLADRGIMTIIQILDDRIRFSMSADPRIAGRLGDFGASLNRCCEALMGPADMARTTTVEGVRGERRVGETVSS